jgi:hypothetical protein
MYKEVHANAAWLNCALEIVIGKDLRGAARNRPHSYGTFQQKRTQDAVLIKTDSLCASFAARHCAQCE